MPQQKTAERVEQSLFHVGREEKFPLLLGLLRREGGDRILIFSNTREEARRLEDRLTRNGYETRALTGDVDQKRRLKILNDFKEGRLPVLVATDVASRGLHIEAVSHDINWDLPQDAEDYVHRIGRTARAGAGGKAVSVVGEASAPYLAAIEKVIVPKSPGGGLPPRPPRGGVGRGRAGPLAMNLEGEPRGRPAVRGLVAPHRVGVHPPPQRQVVGEELERDDGEDRREELAHRRDRDRLRGQGGDCAVGLPHQRGDGGGDLPRAPRDRQAAPLGRGPQ